MRRAIPDIVTWWRRNQALSKKVFKRTVLSLTPPGFSSGVAGLTPKRKKCCWRKDLAEFRGLTHQERSGFLICLEWFENFRLRHSLPAGREAAKAFWSDQVKREGVEREEWQLKQWGEAIRWYLECLFSRTNCKDPRNHIEILFQALPLIKDLWSWILPRVWSVGRSKRVVFDAPSDHGHSP